MRLFFKHIVRTVRKSPWQPLLILLTVVLSVALAVTSTRMVELVSDHAYETAHANTKLGDVLISMRGDSEIRMIFSEDAEALLGDAARVVGEYKLSVFYEYEDRTRVLSAAAVDLVAVDRYFDFTYVQYGAFTTENFDRSVILSQSAAERYGLGVGDPITVRILEETKTYTVQAVARDEGLLTERELLIPISSAVELLATRVPAVSTLGEDFSPYNRLMIRVRDSARLQEVYGQIASSEAFADYSVVLTVAEAYVGYAFTLQTVSIAILALLLVILSGILIGTSMRMLQAERGVEYALFCSVGADRKAVGILQLVESLLYGTLGGVWGILLASPMLAYVCKLFAWQKEVLTVGLGGAIFGMLFALGFMCICTWSRLKKQKLLTLAEWLQEDETHTLVEKGMRQWLLPLAITLLAFLFIWLLPVKWRYLGGALSLLALVWVIAVFSPILIRWIASFGARLIEKSKHPSAVLLLACKNMICHFAVLHAARFLVLLLTLLLTVNFCKNIVSDQLDVIFSSLRGELIVANASESTREDMKNDPAVQGSATFSMIVGVELGENLTAMALIASGDTALCFTPELLPQNGMPVGEQIVLSSGIATLLDAKVGEEVSIVLQGVPRQLTVIEILDTVINLIVLDFDTVKDSLQMIQCVKLSDAALSDPAMREALVAKVEAEGATILEFSDILPSMPYTIVGFLDLLDSAEWIAVVISFAGCANMLGEQYRARRNERRLLRTTGMTNGGIARLYITELLLVTVLSALFAVVFSAVLCTVLNLSVQSFGFQLF